MSWLSTLGSRCARRRVGAALAGGVLALALAPAGIAHAGTPEWSSLKTSGQLHISDLVGTARTPDGRLHVAWTTLRSDSLYDLMQTPVTAQGDVGTPLPIVTGWASIEGPTLLGSGSALLAFFSGTQTLDIGDPSDGLDYAITSDGGQTWGLESPAMATADYAGQRDASVALGPAGALSAWYGIEQTVVHVGTDPTVPDQMGYGSGTGQSVAVSGQSALVAWCTNVQGPNGIYVQAINPSDGTPAGAAQLMPGSTSREGGKAVAYCPATTRVPLVARQDKGFFVASVDGNRRTVEGWSVGATSPINLAGGSSYKQHVASAASPGPKASVWVGWLDGDAIKLRRSNANATVFGATVSVPAPRDGSVYGLDLNAQADRVDLIARVEHDNGTVGLEHAQSFPGLTLETHNGVIPSFRVLDAGDPVSGATVTVGGASATTSQNGTATINVANPGRYIAQATAPKYVEASARVTVEPVPSHGNQR